MRADPPCRHRREDPGPGPHQVQPDRGQAGGDDADGDLECGPDGGVEKVPAGVRAPRESYQVLQSYAASDEDEDSQAEHDHDGCLAAPAGVEAEDERKRQHEDGQVLRDAAARRGVHQRVDVETAVVARVVAPPGPPDGVDGEALEYLE